MMIKILDGLMTPSMKRVSLRMRDNLHDFYVQCRVRAGQIGRLPDFIIIGAQKCGTTYLYSELARHPGVAPALTKEVRFFGSNYRKGVDWYRAHFPAHAQGSITGEATPYYLFYPHTPKRIAKVVPQAKLIVLLRNPANRAYSHYRHEVRLGFERLSFEEALACEQERLRGERERMLADETYSSYTYPNYSYLARGIYVDQLRSWLNIFPRDQVLILKAEDFYGDVPKTLRQITAFLGLPPWEPQRHERPKSFPYPKMDETIRKRLASYFEPYNQQLYEFLGVDLGWK
jgi:sulfotransferase family protein